MDFVKNKRWFFFISGLIIVPGIVFLLIPPALNLGIDFTGGSSITLSFTKQTSQENLRSELVSLGYPDATVQNIGGDSYFVRTKSLSEAEKNNLVKSLGSNLAPLEGDKEDSFDFVSALVAGETVRNSIIAVVVAAIGILLFITYAFRSVPNPFRYGVCAVVALIHDMLIVLGIFAILGQLFDTEVNAMFILGVLTVLGYSVHDTIVVFDRIRENVGRGFSRDMSVVVNVSLMETIGRSLNTSITLLFTLFALLLFGGSTIENFILVLIIGVIAGTYSSIGIASQVLVMWSTGELGQIFRKLPIPLFKRQEA